MNDRIAEVTRNTKETQIRVRVNLDGITSKGHVISINSASFSALNSLNAFLIFGSATLNKPFWACSKRLEVKFLDAEAIEKIVINDLARDVIPKIDL